MHSNGWSDKITLSENFYLWYPKDNYLQDLMSSSYAFPSPWHKKHNVSRGIKLTCTCTSKQGHCFSSSFWIQLKQYVRAGGSQLGQKTAFTLTFFQLLLICHVVHAARLYVILTLAFNPHSNTTSQPNQYMDNPFITRHGATPQILSRANMPCRIGKKTQRVIFFKNHCDQGKERKNYRETYLAGLS